MALSTIDSVGGSAARSVTRGLTKTGIDVRSKVIEALLLGLLGIAMVLLVVLVGDIVRKSWSVWTDRGTDFLTSGLSTASPNAAGVLSAIQGTIVLSAIVVLVAFPLGIACAVYLEELAGPSTFAKWTRVNVRNLAGVPSIVYGLLGLAVFVAALNWVNTPGDWLQKRALPLRYLGNFLDWIGGNNGRSLFAAGLALSALVLPIVVITTMESLRAVPRSIREGAFGVGATQWETIRHHVLPAAGPGILTGTVLSLARATGEAAPVLVVGATTGTLITGNKNIIEQISGPFTALPAAIFSYSRTPGDGYRSVAAAAALVLLALVLAMNAFAIWLRNRYDRKW